DRVSGRHEQARLIMDYDLRDSRQRSRNDWFLAGHRFSNNGWKNVTGATLVDSRSEHKHVASAQSRQHRVLWLLSLKAHPALEVMRLHAGLQFLAQRTIPNDFALEFEVTKRSAGIDEHIETFEFNQ